MNDRVSNASTHLRNKLVNYSDKNIDKNTADAYAYFIANEQELKYLLSAYKVTNRYTIMIRHFTNVFGQVNEEQLKWLLNRNGIYNNFMQIFIIYIFFAIICLSILIATIWYKVRHPEFGPLSVVAGTIGPIVLYLIIGLRLENWSDSFSLTYRLDSRYKNLPRPNQEIGSV